jgi:catechol 2,3-dioxygenase-like lactoylglutathione lyase family enzyme
LEQLVGARLAQVTIDANDVARAAGFWSEALGFRVESGTDGSAKLFPPEDAPPSVCGVWLQKVDEPKVGKVRVHLDLRPDDGDVDAEVERLIALGATRADVGQADDDPFVVLADPDGNEFCVLRTEPH